MAYHPSTQKPFLVTLNLAKQHDTFPRSCSAKIGGGPIPEPTLGSIVGNGQPKPQDADQICESGGLV